MSARASGRTPGPSMRGALLLLTALALPACAQTARELPASRSAPAVSRSPDAWAEEIARFEAADRLSPPARWALVDQIRAANALVRGYAAADPRLLYVDVFSPMLRPDGGPREELFVADRLHLNARGYALWRELLLPIVGHSARSLALVSS